MFGEDNGAVYMYEVYLHDNNFFIKIIFIFIVF